MNDESKRVLLLGATGTIGQATARTLIARGYETVCFVRPRDSYPDVLSGAELRIGDVTDRHSIQEKAFKADRFDAVISCLASRTGEPKDAWTIDYQANLDALSAAQNASVAQFILLSAICVQKPLLAFQQAKLAFERALQQSDLSYSIVRPTAFFKSLSGQVERVRAGKPYVMFGTGDLTACKPISDRDLADYLADCLEDPQLQNRILPIGGPGPAITPKDQGEALFRLLETTPRYRYVSLQAFDLIAGALGMLGWIIPPLRAKAELARIGRYYASESMLVLDPETGEYAAELTPEAGSDRLFDFYEKLITGEASIERGEHAVF